jgi:hypothetical protein
VKYENIEEVQRKFRKQKIALALCIRNAPIQEAGSMGNFPHGLNLMANLSLLQQFKVCVI